MSNTETSEKGLAALTREEGEVLTAYRDVVGVLTIGAGLTAASGVIVPKPGMTISRERARELLRLALRRNYEPAVRAAMPGARQQEFDGAVSFHFNTGAIGRASWVGSWKRKDWPATRRGLLLWVKGGGKVLPGLQGRRLREYAMMEHGNYGRLRQRGGDPASVAQIVIPMTDAEIADARDALDKLGYSTEGIWPFSLVAIARFQNDHGLTADGIVGRATLTTLQRRIDARRKTGRTIASGGGGAVATQVPGIGETLSDAEILAGLAVVTAFALLWLAWRYRDVVAVKVQHVTPKLATWLRNR